jgi:hypothetical protein
MPVREGPPQPAPPSAAEPPPYPAEKARGAEINLRTPGRRLIFFGAFLAAALLLILLRVLA